MIDTSRLTLAGGLDVPLPRMARIRQRFAHHRLEDVAGEVARQLERPGIGDRIVPGASIAIGVGSRGIANLAEVVRALVEGIRARGGRPFIVPAMGSHAGATIEGQTALLAGYGITEEGVGAPVRATMETVVPCRMADGTPVHVDRLAFEADGIVLVNRIKPHTTVRGRIQSGLIKMMIIGMGKIAGATVMHTRHGMERFDTALPEAAAALLPHIPFLFGLALVEDAHDDTAIVEAIPPERLIEREAALLETATAYMGRLYFDDIDVLVIDRIGKEISGAGFDPNVAGRNSRGVAGFDHPRVQKVVLLDLTDATHGNATGVGMADVITRRLLERIDFGVTYANVITSTRLDGGAIPVVMETPPDAVRLAVKTLHRVKPEDARIVRIRDTLSLEELFVSEPMLAEVRAHPDMEVLDAPAEMIW